MKKRLSLAGLQRLFATAVAIGSGCGTQPAPTFAGAPVFRVDAHFAVIGDLQRTMIWGRLAMAEQNDPERRQLLGELARTGPAFAVMVGDLVADGSSLDHWKEFDERSEVLRRSNIPVFAVPGNHEYMFGGRANLRHYFARLPHLANQNWYARQFGNLALVFLDSNAGALSERWDRQKQWYETTLKQFEDDPAIRGVVVFLHHAPFTNSSLVKDDMDVQRAFLPAFRERQKTMAMVTGHAHGYEHFDRNGKAFIVTGGGGGPRFPLLQGEKRRHVDDKYDGPPLRPFNFVELSIRDSGLHGYVVGLPKGCHDFCRIETFDLSWSTPGENAPAGHAHPDRDLPDCGKTGNEASCPEVRTP